MSIIRYAKQEPVESIESLKQKIADNYEKSLLENKFSTFEFRPIYNDLYKCEKSGDRERYSEIYSVIRDVDRFSRISPELGKKLDNLMKDSENNAYLYKGNLGKVEMIDDFPYNSNLDSLLRDGLISKANPNIKTSTYNELEGTPVIPLNSVRNIFSLIITTFENDISILLQIPKDLVDGNIHFLEEFSSDIVSRRENDEYINPKYIVGAIIKGPNSKRDEFYSKEELLREKNLNI